MTHRTRTTYSQAEDKKPIGPAGMYGPKRMDFAVKLSPSRSKNYREQFHQYLIPTTNHIPFNSSVDDEMNPSGQKIGHRWTETSQRLRNRRKKQIDNWSYSRHGGRYPSQRMIDGNSNDVAQQRVASGTQSVPAAPGYIVSPKPCSVMRGKVHQALRDWEAEEVKQRDPRMSVTAILNPPPLK